MERAEKHIVKCDSKVKKRWEKPILDSLDVTKTKSGDISYSTEGSWWIFTWGS